MSPYIILLLIMLVVSQTVMTMGFVVVPTGFTGDTATTKVNNSNRLSSSFLLAKKKKNNNQAGRGFGKQPEIVEKSENTSTLRSPPSQQQSSSSSSSSYFTSVDGGSGAIPKFAMEESTTTSASKSENVEDRTGNILRGKYGLRTREEQEAEELKQKQVEEQRKKISKWKQLADEGQDFDLLQILPDPVLIFIDRFLKFGLTVSTILFIFAGMAITVEAGSKALSSPLPIQVDNFITNIVEPNFTPGLGVLLSFSVGLGLFASLQLNSAASTYREDQ
mmetsp:Transcript_42172/g.47114  ORF Transcript_42172/g.47114 Transcript_42172/m.47114 type:complete len:277 (-) Transcript_42172:306-1136(-)